MAKTVNTLNVGDKLLLPTIEVIREIEITSINKDINGIRIGTADYRAPIHDSDYNSAISPIATFEGKDRIFYLRMEDAIVEQNKLQNAHLTKLQDEVKNSLQKLNDFTLKYFTK